MTNVPAKSPAASREDKTERKKIAFLKAFQKSRMIVSACAASHVSRGSVLNWRKNDRQFAAVFDEVEGAIGEAAEAEAWRRAVEGFDRPVRFQGEVVGTERVYSDSLLMQVLRARHPSYRENAARVDVNVSANVGLMVMPATMAEAEWTQLAENLTATQARISAQVIEAEAEHVPANTIRRG